MSVTPLSARINLEHSRKQAKDLVKAFKAGDSEALDHIRWNHPRFRGLTDVQIQRRKFALADAQLVIARRHAFESWPKLLKHIDALAKKDPRIMRFEEAADAIIAGDIPKLRAMLREHPELVRERSTRAQHAPLLHYVAANGVEDYRQVTPANIVEVAQLLLDAGAEVNATSDAYGGGSTALGLVATSAHPRRAGLQIPLIDLLLTHGARIDDADKGWTTVMAALANDCPEAAVALVERGARVDSIVAAAGVGRFDLVKRFAESATKEQLEKALVMAARFGTYEILEYLLEQGVDVAASDGMTALHQAAGRGNLPMIELLLQRGAPLEAKNVFGGTVLASTLWFAFNVSPSEFERIDYPSVLDALRAAGARTDCYPEMPRHIETVYRRAGKKPPAS
jgi:ankyrin repeat protein